MMMTVVLKMQMMHPLGPLSGRKLPCIFCYYMWHIAYWYKTMHSMYIHMACLCVLFTYLQQNASKPPFAQNKFSYTLRTACHPFTQVWSFCQHGWGKGIWWWKPEAPASHLPWFWQKMCEIRPRDYRWVFSWPKRGGETEILYVILTLYFMTFLANLLFGGTLLQTAAVRNCSVSSLEGLMAFAYFHIPYHVLIGCPFRFLKLILCESFVRRMWCEKLHCREVAVAFECVSQFGFTIFCFFSFLEFGWPHSATELGLPAMQGLQRECCGFNCHAAELETKTGRHLCKWQELQAYQVEIYWF